VPGGCNYTRGTPRTAGQSPTTFSPFTFEGPTDVANLERIEVLKGPSALLYGRGEPGGTVNYVTRTPAFETQSSFQQYFGSFDFYRTEVHVQRRARVRAPRREARCRLSDQRLFH